MNLAGYIFDNSIPKLHNLLQISKVMTSVFGIATFIPLNFEVNNYFCFLSNSGLRHQRFGRLWGDDFEGVRLQQGRKNLQEGVDHDPARPLKAEHGRLKIKEKRIYYEIDRPCLFILVSTFFFFIFHLFNLTSNC